MTCGLQEWEISSAAAEETPNWESGEISAMVGGETIEMEKLSEISEWREKFD